MSIFIYNWSINSWFSYFSAATLVYIYPKSYLLQTKDYPTSILANTFVSTKYNLSLANLARFHTRLSNSLPHFAFALPVLLQLKTNNTIKTTIMLMKIFSLFHIFSTISSNLFTIFGKPGMSTLPLGPFPHQPIKILALVEPLIKQDSKIC